jgi:CubicO group peptidase (beta-lactamase class C family)
MKTVTWIKLLAALVFLFSIPASQAAVPGFKADIENVLAEEGLAGVAWVLIRAPDETVTGASGLKDNRAGLTFDSNTRIQVGSIAKSVLATGILRLATERRIDLDAPVLLYLPNLFTGNPPAGFNEITVRHLLDHTAGLNDGHLWQMFSERASADAPLIEAFPDPAKQLQLRSKAGSRFSYSNMGYTLLGMIIEAIVGERYEAYLDEHLLSPLSMHDSTFTFVTQEGPPADPELAWGHVDDGSGYAAGPMFLRPAGQFTTTAADLAELMKFLLGDGNLDGRAFVDQALMKSRGIPAGTEASSAGLNAGYALGLARRDRHGKVGDCHGGNVVGFVAMLCIFPDEYKAFAYAVNTDSETANYGRLDELFVEALDIADAVAPETAYPPPATPEWLGHYVLNPNRFRMFEYLDTVFSSIKLSIDGDHIALSSLQKDTRRLRPVGEFSYSANDRTTTSHVLIRGRAGEYLISDGFLTYQKVSSAYLFAHWTSLALGVAGLLWFLIAGSVSLAKFGRRLILRPEMPAYLASVFLFVPVPFFLNQSFMALGDVTIASALLALATISLPAGMFATLVFSIRARGESRLFLLHAAAAFLVLQWSAVLIMANLLPFRLWS